MPSRPLLCASIFVAVLAGGCGAEGPEEAPNVATAAAIAKAPPGAIGANVPRPPGAVAPDIEPTVKKKGPGAPKPPTAPPDPLLQGQGGATPKGTDL